MYLREMFNEKLFEILNKNKDCDRSATSLCDNFVKVNEETSNLLIPKKEKLKNKDHSRRYKNHGYQR